MKSLIALCVFSCAIAFGNAPLTEDCTDPALTTVNALENTIDPELMEELNSLTSEEEIVAFFKEHPEVLSSLPTEDSATAVVSGGCGSWITVARCVQTRQCWVGTTSNGVRYGFYWQTRVTC